MNDEQTRAEALLEGCPPGWVRLPSYVSSKSGGRPPRVVRASTVCSLEPCRGDDGSRLQYVRTSDGQRVTSRATETEILGAVALAEERLGAGYERLGALQHITNAGEWFLRRHIGDAVWLHPTGLWFTVPLGDPVSRAEAEEIREAVRRAIRAGKTGRHMVVTHSDRGNLAVRLVPYDRRHGPLPAGTFLADIVDRLNRSEASADGRLEEDNDG